MCCFAQRGGKLASSLHIGHKMHILTMQITCGEFFLLLRLSKLWRLQHLLLFQSPFVCSYLPGLLGGDNPHALPRTGHSNGVKSFAYNMYIFFRQVPVTQLDSPHVLQFQEGFTLSRVSQNPPWSSWPALSKEGPRGYVLQKEGQAVATKSQETPYASEYKTW